MKKKIRKCGYARVSTTAEEQEHSLIFQTQYYKALIESEKDSEFVGIYADTKSGKTARIRKQFKAMIQAARRGEIDYIITKSISRFARKQANTKVQTLITPVSHELFLYQRWKRTNCIQ